jgi:hypothetical protein
VKENFLRTLVFVVQGCVSGVFSIIPFVWDIEKATGDDYLSFVRKLVIDELRRDREKGAVPGPGPFFYSPVKKSIFYSSVKKGIFYSPVKKGIFYSFVKKI